MSAVPREAPTGTGGNDASPALDAGRDLIEYLFISHTLEVGGIETLLVRMTEALVRDGYRVTVLAPDGPIGGQLASGVERIDWDCSAVDITRFVPSERTTRLRIWCSLPSIMIDAWPLQQELWKRRRVRSVCTSGIFHPDQWYHGGKRSLAFLNGRLIQRLSEPGAIYFMNDASRAAHVSRWGDDLSDWPVFRLHLEAKSGVQWKPHPSSMLRIVSVGRIVPFKNYNYDAMDVLAELEAAGIDASWDIYGDGPDRALLSSQAQARGLSKRLRFPGEIEYDQLHQRLADYDLFVGMGTAALEAASIGMPTILALSDQPRGSYGFLHEAPSDSVAELVAGVPPVDIAGKIQEFARAGPAARSEIGELCRQSAFARSGDERSPFDAMFEAGRHVPGRFLPSIRAGLLAGAQRLRRHLRRNGRA